MLLIATRRTLFIIAIWSSVGLLIVVAATSTISRSFGFTENNSVPNQHANTQSLPGESPSMSQSSSDSPTTSPKLIATILFAHTMITYTVLFMGSAGLFGQLLKKHMVYGCIGLINASEAQRALSEFTNTDDDSTD